MKEKKSVHEDYSKDDEPKKKKWNDKRTIKCPLVGDYKKKELTGLLEEEIVGNLDSGYLLGAKCSACQKVIVSKTKLADEEKATKTLFNRKFFLFTCDNFRAANGMSCVFCMCGQCHVDLHINDKNDNNKGTRRSRRSRK